MNESNQLHVCPWCFTVLPYDALLRHTLLKHPYQVADAGLRAELVAGRQEITG